MFSLISGKSGSRSRSKLKASYDCYQLNPGEAESISMTRHLLDAGRIDDAFRWTRKARSHFPDSTRIDKLYRKTRKVKMRVALSEAQALARRDPTVKNLVRASELLLLLSGNWKKAHRECLKTQKEFPESWEVDIVLGRIFYQQFSETREQKPGWAAVSCLERALQKSPHDYRCLLLIAMTLVRLDQIDDALIRIEEILRVKPHDAKATSLLAYVERLVPASFAAEAGKAPAKGADDNPLDTVMSIPDAVGAFELSADGEVIDSLVGESGVFDFSAPVEVLESMAAACHLDTRRLGLGELVCCTLRGEGWNMGYRPTGSGSVLVFLEGGDVSEEQIAVDMESVLGPACASVA